MLNAASHQQAHASGKASGVSALFVALAALFWGISGGIGAILTDQGWSPIAIAFCRGAIGWIFVALWLIARHHNSGLARGRLWIWSIVGGLGVAGNFTFYFWSIAEGGVAVAAPLMYCAPVFVYLVSFALKLEKPDPCKWAAIAMVLIGIVLLTEIHSLGSGRVTPIAVAAGLLSGLSYAIFIFGFKFAAPHGSPQTILLIAFTVLVVVLFALGDKQQTLAVFHASKWYLFVLLGVLGAGVSFILYLVGLRHTAPAIASVVAMIEPVTASLFGVIFLGETLAALQIVGMVLIVLAVTTLSVYSSKTS